MGSSKVLSWFSQLSSERLSAKLMSRTSDAKVIGWLTGSRGSKWWDLSTLPTDSRDEANASKHPKGVITADILGSCCTLGSID